MGKTKEVSSVPSTASLVAILGLNESKEITQSALTTLAQAIQSAIFSCHRSVQTSSEIKTPGLYRILGDEPALPDGSKIQPYGLIARIKSNSSDCWEIAFLTSGHAAIRFLNNGSQPFAWHMITK